MRRAVSWMLILAFVAPAAQSPRRRRPRRGERRRRRRAPGRGRRLRRRGRHPGSGDPPAFAAIPRACACSCRRTSSSASRTSRSTTPRRPCRPSRKRSPSTRTSGWTRTASRPRCCAPSRRPASSRRAARARPCASPRRAARRRSSAAAMAVAAGGGRPRHSAAAARRAHVLRGPLRHAVARLRERVRQRAAAVHDPRRGHEPAGDPVPITSVTTVVTIEVSPSFPGEIGFASSQPSTVVPSSIPAKQSVTLQISSFLICGNGEGDPAAVQRVVGPGDAHDPGRRLHARRRRPHARQHPVGSAKSFSTVESFGPTFPSARPLPRSVAFYKRPPNRLCASPSDWRLEGITARVVNLRRDVPRALESRRRVPEFTVVHRSMRTNILTLASELSDHDLLARIGVLAASEREATVELVAHLAALDSRPSLYAAQGHGSLFSYCTRRPPALRGRHLQPDHGGADLPALSRGPRSARVGQDDAHFGSDAERDAHSGESRGRARAGQSIAAGARSRRSSRSWRRVPTSASSIRKLPTPAPRRAGARLADDRQPAA